MSPSKVVRNALAASISCRSWTRLRLRGAGGLFPQLLFALRSQTRRACVSRVLGKYRPPCQSTCGLRGGLSRRPRSASSVRSAPPAGPSASTGAAISGLLLTKSSSAWAGTSTLDGSRALASDSSVFKFRSRDSTSTSSWRAATAASCDSNCLRAIATSLPPPTGFARSWRAWRSLFNLVSYCSVSVFKSSRRSCRRLLVSLVTSWR